MGAAVWALAGPPRAAADDAGAAELPHKSYTGKIAAVNAKDRVLELEGVFVRKQFNLGDNCLFTKEDKSAGTINDLRPGQRVTVAYQESHGVRVADRVLQLPLVYEGTVKTCDPAGRTLTLRVRGMDRSFQIADGCKVLLRDDQSGALADIQTGNYVTVTYETPKDKPTAWKIMQTSESFTGTLTAIDLEAKTLKAKAGFETKAFTLGDHCAMVVNGKIGGQLADFKPNDKLVISYDEINGVNVANRIAPAGTPQPTEAGGSKP